MRHKKRKKSAMRVLTMAVVVVAVLAMLAVIAFSQVFVVRNVIVVGNRNLLSEEIITLSGVKPGDNLLGITSDMLKSRLEQSRYVEYTGHGFDYRGTLTLKIKERLGMAVTNVLGLYYVLDESGVVLECAGSNYALGVAGPKVTGLGLDANSRVTVGEKMPVRDEAQLETMERVLHALDETNLLGRASQLDVKNLDNIYIMMQDGAKVELGNDSKLHTKLLITREVLTLREDIGDLQGAKIDVSNGENAHYIPPVLPTLTPVPTATPTVAPPMTPEP